MLSYLVAWVVVHRNVAQLLVFNPQLCLLPHSLALTCREMTWSQSHRKFPIQHIYNEVTVNVSANTTGKIPGRLQDYRLPTCMNDEMTWRMGNDKTLKLVLKNFNWTSQVSKSYWFGRRTAWKLYELNWYFNAYKIYDAKHRAFVPEIFKSNTRRMSGE